MTNTVRPYAWGSRTAIPALLGVEPTGEPQAELWMGAHPGAPSLLDRPGDGSEQPRPLDAVISADPDAELGPAVTARFGPRLPFLLKVLAAAQPLSLQVHPDLTQAHVGFAEEEARGVPLDASHRNYKDPNHKPEMLVALGDFDGLCGFRRAADAAEVLAGLGVPALAHHIDTLRAKPEPEALREVLTAVLTADRAALAPAVEAIAAALPENEALSPEARAAYSAVAATYPGDPGVIAALLLNHVRLAAGEALYLGAGVPHAYLSGLGVEIMANSDNVLRCGLTPKHVDVPELLRIVRFEGIDPTLVRPVAESSGAVSGESGEFGESGEEVYPAPIEDFRLSTLPAGTETRLPSGLPTILLCTSGEAVLTAAGNGQRITLGPGRSAFLPASGPDALVQIPADGTVFRATVNIPAGAAA